MYKRQAHYNGDWLMRAATAKAGIYGNNADEAVYPLGRADANGNTIDTSKHNYTITFAKGQMPPVNALSLIHISPASRQYQRRQTATRYHLFARR